MEERVYLLNEILLFGEGRRLEAIDRLTWIFGLFAPHPGFKRAILGRYLGDTTRHTVLRFWDSEDSFQAFRASPDGGYGRNRPEGIYVGEHVLNPLTTYAEVSGSASGDFLVQIQQAVPEDQWDQFQEHQTAVLAVFSKAPAFVWATCAKADAESQNLTILRFSNRHDYEKVVDGSEYRHVMASLPGSVEHIRTQCFEVLRDGSPK
jgi:heme-degrading monooxygenase HmoA